MAAPPLWKALLCYFATLLVLFAVLGLIGADGNPLGIVTGVGILVVIHFAPLGGMPTNDPVLDLAIVAALAAGTWALLRLLPQWWRIGLAIALAMAWFARGLAILAQAT